MAITSAPPAIGQPAPDFTAPSTSGRVVTLSEFRGKSSVLLAFFPLAFTSTCTEQLCEITGDYSAFQDAGVTVLPMSVDHTASLKEYRDKYRMRVELLSDFRRDISRLYGVLNEEKFYSNRAYFLVDKSGILQWMHTEELNKHKRSNDELLTEIARLG